MMTVFEGCFPPMTYIYTHITDNRKIQSLSNLTVSVLVDKYCIVLSHKNVAAC